METLESKAITEEMEKRFLHHPPTSQGVIDHHAEFRRRFLELAKFCAERLGPCREGSLVQTKLEEASFWAHAAIARSQIEHPSSHE